eukprot:scaffold17284_cov90-Isochrysis_galbana.AAC.1
MEGCNLRWGGPRRLFGRQPGGSRGDAGRAPGCGGARCMVGFRFHSQDSSQGAAAAARGIVAGGAHGRCGQE